MSLPTQNISVNLRPLNQQAPQSAGPTGRVDRINNGMVTKFLGDKLRIEKRPGFTPLPTTTYAAGSAVSAPTHPKLFSSWRDQLVLVGGSTPYVFSDALDRWERFSSVYATAPNIAPQTLASRSLYTSSDKAYTPDGAAVGNVLCDVLVDSVLGSLVTLVDADGVQIRAPFSPTGTAKVKVTSDSVRFWVYSQNTNQQNTYIQVFDTNGAQLATATLAWGAARAIWDVGYQSVNGKVFNVTSTGATTTVTYSSYAGGVITSNAFTPAIDSTLGLGRLENTIGGTAIYIAAVNAATDVTGYQISSAGAISHTYTIAAALGAVGNVTGFVMNGSFDITVVASVLVDNTVTPSKVAMNNSTYTYTATFAGVTSAGVRQRSLAIVSRAYPDADGIWRVVTYYQSTGCFAIAGTVRDVSELGAQPSFFVLDISALVPTVVGQFALGSAYAFYATSRNSVVYNPFYLASVAADSSGVQHVPLGFLGAQTPVPAVAFVTAGFASATGIIDYTIAQTTGKPLPTADNLLLPGMQAVAFDGASFVEAAPQLAPEITNGVPGAGGSLTVGERYFWTAVYRFTDAAGNVYRSAPAVVWNDLMSGANNQETLTISTLRTTAILSVVIEVYRTFAPLLSGTTTGVVLNKVGEVANTVLADTVTFVDQFSDTSASRGQPLYAQILDSAPALSHAPPPAFSTGCTFQGREFLVGYDNAVWFSGDRVEGEGAWFNARFRILIPSADRILAVIPMDTRIVILCERSLWAIPGGNLPNANLTSGSIPTAEQLPFTTGATGPSLMTPSGAVYAADRGIWNMDRGLAQQFIGAGVLDEVDSTSHPTSIAIDDNQRIYFTMSTDGRALPATALTELLVFDLVAGCWYTWDMPTTPAATTTWNGRFAYVDYDNCTVFVEDVPESSTYTDDGDAIITTISVSSMSFGGPNGWQRLWGVEFYGQWYGPHLLQVTFDYDNEPTAQQTFTYPWGTDPSVYRAEIRQDKQKDIAAALTFSDSFTWPALTTILAAVNNYLAVGSVTGFVVGNTYRSTNGSALDAGTFTVTEIDTQRKRLYVLRAGGWTPTVGRILTYNTTSLSPGNTFALEAIGLRIGVKPGLGRLPTTRRISP